MAITTKKPRSDQVQTGRYVQGGTVVSYNNRLGWWSRRIFSSSPDDVEIVLPAKYNKRPDLLAAEIYGKSNLQWIVLQYNNIIDINTEFITGKTIIVPTAKRVFTQFLAKSSVDSIR